MIEFAAGAAHYDDVTKRRDFIDADYRLVREEPPRRWNGVGLPPEWPTWGLWPRATFVVTWGLVMGSAYLGIHALAHLIGW